MTASGEPAGDAIQGQARTYRTFDGLELFYRDWGEADPERPALLCLPGLTRNSADFDLFARRHAGGWRVICPDYRGRGRSPYDPNWRNYHALVYLEDLRHLLAAVAVTRVVAVGTSMGGLLALALTVSAPSLVEGVVLNDVGPQLAGGGVSRILDFIGRDHPQPNWETAVSELRRLLPNLSLETDRQWLDFARATFRPGSDGLLHVDWDVNLARPLTRAASDLPDLWAMFRYLSRIPAFAVRGGESDLLTAETFARMAHEVPGLVQVVVEGCGHAPTLDEPVVVEAMDAFFANWSRQANALP